MQFKSEIADLNSDITIFPIFILEFGEFGLDCENDHTLKDKIT